MTHEYGNNFTPNKLIKKIKKKVPTIFGTEVDIRSNASELILNPLTKYKVIN